MPVKVLRLRIALIRREVKQLAAIAEKRAAEAESSRAAPRFRPLTETETETILGADLLAAVAAGTART